MTFHGNNINQLPQNPGMHLISSHGLVTIYFHQGVPNFLLDYSERNFSTSVPTQRFRYLRDTGNLTARGDLGEELSGYLSLLHICNYCSPFSFIMQVHSYILLGFSLGFLFLINVFRESLIILHIQWCHSLPDPIPTYSNCIHIPFPGSHILVSTGCAFPSCFFVWEVDHCSAI